MPAFDPTVLNSLNGQTFGPGQIGSTSFVSPGYPNYVADPTQGFARATYFTSLNADALTISNINASYTPGGPDPGGGSSSVYPTFGSFTGTYTDINGVVLSVHTFYIHGVSSDALMISTYRDLFANASFQVLSNNDLGAGPTSPGYPDAATLAAAFAADVGESGTTFTYMDVDNYSTITLTLFDVDDDGVADHTGKFTGNPNPPTFPLVFDNNAAAYVAPVCFAEGTRILTTRGEVAVEDLVEGDEAVTAGGAVRPVIWVGSRHMRCDRHPNPSAVHPVRVRAGAFADGVPSRDLRLSPGHAVTIDGVLVEISLLANGATIVSEPVDAIRYFHVELDAHDVILAEGLACESYLDDGNRETFGNAPGHLALYGRLDPVDWDQACLPIERHGPRTEALRARLRARAEDLGWRLAADVQLMLEADGQAVAPVFSTAQRAWFLVPAARRLVLRSPASVPAVVAPGHADPRRLGVAVSALRVGGEVVDLASDALDQGFHAPERQEVDGVHRLWRWTDGAAELPATPASTMIEIEVSMASPRWVAPDQTFNQASPIAPRLRLVEAG